MAVSSSFLKVFAQAELEESIIPIVEAQTIVGRGQDCAAALIPAKGLSRHHVEILVDGSEHFIKDLGSRNKTYRFTHQLRPHVYYELRNNTELHLANVKCLYIVPSPVGILGPDKGAPPVTEEQGVKTTCVQTLQDSDQSTVDGEDNENQSEKDDVMCRNDIEPTQPYFAEDPGEEEDIKDRIECESTVPYNEEGVSHMSDDEDDISSAHSSPILGGKGSVVNQQDIESINSEGNVAVLKVHKVSFDPVVCSSGEDTSDEADHTLMTVALVPGIADSNTEPSNTKHASKYAARGTIPVENTAFEGQIIPVETTMFEGQTIPVENTTFEGQTIPVETTMFEGQTIPVENTMFEGQTIPVENTTFEGQTIPTVDTLFDDQSCVTTVGKQSTNTWCTDTAGSTVNRQGEPLKQYGPCSADQNIEQTVVYDGGNKTVEPVEPTVAYDLDADEGAEDLEDRKDVSSILFSEQENSLVKDALPVTSAHPSNAWRDGCADEDAYSDTNVQIRSPLTHQDNSDERSVASELGGSLDQAQKIGGSLDQVQKIGGSLDQAQNIGGSQDKPGTEDDFSDELSSLIPTEATGRYSKQKVSTLQRGRGKRTCVGRRSSMVVASGSEHAEEVRKKSSVSTSSVVESGWSEQQLSAGCRKGKKKARGFVSERESKLPEVAEPSKASIAIADTPRKLMERNKESDLTSEPLEEDEHRSPIICSTVSKSPPTPSSSTPPTSSSTPPTSSSSTCSLVPSLSSKGSHTSAKRSIRAKATPGKSLKPSLNAQGSSPSLRPKCSSEVEKPCVLFTGIVYQEGENIVRELGGLLVDSVYECTHLVTDKMVRTIKLLCCLSRGCHIVSSRWLDQCQVHGAFLPADGFLLKDRTAERQHNFSLQRSLQQARQVKLLDGYKIFMTSNVTPDRAALSDIIKCSGGQLLDVLPTTKDDQTLIISCDQDLHTCNSALDAGLVLYTPELILSGALRQELDLKTNILSRNPGTQLKGGAKRKAEHHEEASTKRRRK